VQLALHCGRADWKRFLNELTLDEYDTIHALRSLEFVAHEREDWRLAIAAAAIANSAGMREEPLTPEQVLRLIQLREEVIETVTPSQAAAMARGQRGDVRRSGSSTHAR
jgi:hypothetical protein